MKEENASYLDKMFSNYEKSKFDLNQRLLDEEQQRKEFLRRFDLVVNDIIAPTMKEFGAYLQTKGHDYTIGNSFEEKAIFMHVFPYKKQNYSHPSISFLAIDSTHAVTVHTKAWMPNEEGTEKYIGEFNLDVITKDFVEKQIVDLLKQCFAGYHEVSSRHLSLWK